MARGSRVFKAAGSQPFAHPSALRVLLALAPPSLLDARERSSLAPAVSPAELRVKTGMKRRTLQYWLRKLVSQGFAVRLGKRNSPAILYALTPAGAQLLVALSSNRALIALSTAQPLLRTAEAGRAFAAGGGGVGVWGGVSAGAAVAGVGLALNIRALALCFR